MIVNHNIKKVIIFSTAYLPLVGGAEIAIKELTDRLGDYEFDLITARLNAKLPKNERISRVNVYRIGFGGAIDKLLLPFWGCFLALRLNKKREYDIIWAIMASYGGIAASFFKFFCAKKKFVLTLQEGDEESHLKRYAFGISFLYRLFIYPLYTLPIRSADVIQAISNYLKDRARKSGAKCDIKIVPNGVNVFLFKNKGSDVGAIRKELGFGKLDNVLVTVSRLVKKNAVLDLVRSLSFLPNEIKLLIIGEGNEREKIKKVVSDLGLEKRVKIIGFVSHANLPKYLHASDVFVRASLSEGMGNAFLEAMAAGLPVIATPVGGIVDFLIDQKTGLFCDVNSPESIAQVVQKLINNPELARLVNSNSFKMVSERYDWNRLAEDMREVFV